MPRLPVKTTIPLVTLLLLILSGCEAVGGAVDTAVDSATGLFLNDGQKILSAGIQQYEEGQYEAATRNLESALEAELSTKDQVQAHKYLAFIACVTSNPEKCRTEFRMALDIDPEMMLEASEAGHPIWDPVFQEEKARGSE